LTDLTVHGGAVERLPNTLCVAIPGVDANKLLERVKRVATAAGAACHAGEAEPSGVLLAMSVPEALALCTLRLTTGRPTSTAEIDEAADEISREALALR
jgi:cysteine desulfurase